MYALSETFGPRDLFLVDVTTLTVTAAIPLQDEAHVITWVGAQCSKSGKSGKSDKSGKSARC